MCEDPRLDPKHAQAHRKASMVTHNNPAAEEAETGGSFELSDQLVCLNLTGSRFSINSSQNGR